MTLRLLQRVAPSRAVIAATDAGAHVVPGVDSIRVLALRASRRGGGLFNQKRSRAPNLRAPSKTLQFYVEAVPRSAEKTRFCG